MQVELSASQTGFQLSATSTSHNFVLDVLPWCVSMIRMCEVTSPRLRGTAPNSLYSILPFRSYILQIFEGNTTRYPYCSNCCRSSGGYPLAPTRARGLQPRHHLTLAACHVRARGAGDVPDGNDALWSLQEFLEPNATTMGTSILM